MTNLNNSENMSEEEVKEFSELLRKQMSGVHFPKDAKFVKNKSPWAIGIAAAAVSAIAISLSLSSGTITPTWAAEPNANSALQSSSEAACAKAHPVGNPVEVTAPENTSASSTAKDGLKQSASGPTNLSSGTSGILSAGPSSKVGAVVGSDQSTITFSSAPSVQAFDSRGSYTVTVLSGTTTDNGNATMICVTSSSKTGSPVSGLSVMATQVNAGPGPDIFNVTSNKDGTKSAIGFGPLVAGATQVVLSATGLPDAHATIDNGRYAIWWPYDANSSAVLKEMDSDGKILKAIDVPVTQVPNGGAFSMSSKATDNSAGTTSSNNK